MPSSRLVLGGLAAIVLLLGAGVHTQMHTRVEVIDDTCDAQLQYLWGNYTNPPVAPIAGCDSKCLAACQVTLDWAIYSEKQQNCPLQTDIIRCFHVSCGGRGGGAGGSRHAGRRQAGWSTSCCSAWFPLTSGSPLKCSPLSTVQVYRAPWIMFVNKCALFQYGTSVRLPTLSWQQFGRLVGCWSRRLVARCCCSPASVTDNRRRYLWRCRPPCRAAPRPRARAQPPLPAAAAAPTPRQRARPPQRRARPLRLRARPPRQKRRPAPLHPLRAWQQRARWACP